MRGGIVGGSFSEHVSTYFNSVIDSFYNYYYQPSASSYSSLFFPKLSIFYDYNYSQEANGNNANHAHGPVNENLNVYPRTLYIIFLITLLVLYLFKRVLHLDEMGANPIIHMSKTQQKVPKQTTDAERKGTFVHLSTSDDDGSDAEPSTMEQLIEKCGLLKTTYKPTWFWGKSGHIQTLLFGVMQKPHKAVDLSESKQYYATLEDGSLVSFHVFEALKPHQSGEDITLIMCPGIFGSYNKSYVQSTVGAAIGRGYRIVCLDHLGVLPHVPLKTPRLFTYGNTEEYAAVCEKAFKMFQDSKFIAVGYSMGGNQVCKYLGEDITRQEKFLSAVSICQGYDCIRASIGLSRWDKLQVLYSYILTQRWISLIARHPIMLEAASVRGINWKEQTSCRSLKQFDRLFSTKFYGYDKFEDFMRNNSCSQHLEKIDIPVLLINARDDPLIGPFYHDIPINLSKSKRNVAFVETQHGGHLGFFEDGMIFPREVWIDTVILEYCDVVVDQLSNCSSSYFTTTPEQTSSTA